MMRSHDEEHMKTDNERMECVNGAQTDSEHRSDGSGEAQIDRGHDLRWAPSVQEKRQSLLSSQRKLQVGRRETPEPTSLKERNKATIRGLIAGVVVVVLAIILLMVVGRTEAFALLLTL